MKKLFVILTIVLLLAPGLAMAGAPNIEMVFVKGGCYQMGDTFGEGGSDEKPVHEVCVDDFYIGKYEVTQAQWQAVMGSNPSRFKGANRPVETVSWDDAKAFTRKLKSMTGKKYRLPSEAEWEYAARSGGKKELFAGTSDQFELEEYAWYADTSGKQTHPVGQLEPNGLGLYDMSGNVWEWCRDRYDAEYYKNSPKQNPPGPMSGSSRVRRGGSWFNSPSGVRAADRSSYAPGSRYDGLGFRLVLPTVR